MNKTILIFFFKLKWIHLTNTYEASTLSQALSWVLGILRYTKWYGPHSHGEYVQCLEERWKISR